MSTTYMSRGGQLIEIASGRPRKWGAPRRCPVCGAAPVFAIVHKRSTGEVSSHIGSRGQRAKCPGKPDSNS